MKFDLREVEIILAQSDSDEDIDDSDLTLEDILNEDKIEEEDTLIDDQQLLELILEKRSPALPLQSTPTQFVGRTPLQIAESREKRLLDVGNKEIVSPLQVKRRLRARSSRRTKSPTENEEILNATAQLHVGVGGGVVKVEPMEAISRQLQKNLQFRSRGPGSPTAVAIHPKFIAIGTSKSLVIVFDHFQNVRQVLGNVNDSEADGPVTAIDVSPGNDFLVCGYQSGRIVLWDMLKGTSLKAVSDAHDNPVVSIRFYKDQKPAIVSVDTNGIVNKLNFSKMMGYMYIVDIDLILDGAAGKIPSISVLPSSIGHAKISNFTDQYSLIALSSDRVTFILAIEPEVKVLHRWQKPDDIAEEDALLPSLSFDWVLNSGNQRYPTAVLSRGWGKHVQFLEATFSGGEKHNHGEHGWPGFEVRDELATSSDVVAIQWIGDQIVVYLNLQDELCVYDTASRHELEVVDVSSTELVYAIYKDTSKDGKGARSFANSFRACNDILYLLGLKELQTVRVQSWTQRIDTLTEDGEWLEALALALDHYEGLKAAARERAERDRFAPVFFRDIHNDQCVVDISRMSHTNQKTREKHDVQRNEDGKVVRWTCGDTQYSLEVSKKLETAFQKGRNGSAEANVPMSVVERVADLLMDYVRLAIANAPASSPKRLGNTFDLAKSHYQMLGGVCIEYCCVINRRDILFGDIFQRFKDCNRSDIFVELLEPYILSKKLGYLSPQVMQDFVDLYTKKQQLPVVEQCLLNLNVKQVDFDTILRLCQENNLFSALIYVHNVGLHDYITPIGILLKASQPILTKSTTSSVEMLKDSPEYRNQRLYGYKLLVYISYCFTRRSFPSGEIDVDQRMGVRAQVCIYLFTKEDVELEGEYPRLRLLIALDAKEFLGVVSTLFDSPDVEFEDENNSEISSSSSSNSTSSYRDRSDPSIKCPSRLSMTLALAQVIVGKPGANPLESNFSTYEQAQLLMFEAKLLSSGAIDAKTYAEKRSSGETSSWMMDSLMHFLAVGTVPSQNRTSGDQQETIDRDERQAMLVRLIQKLPKSTFNEAALLTLVKQESLNRAAVVLHKDRNEFSSAVGAYLMDKDNEYRLGVFAYIRNELDKTTVDEPTSRGTPKMMKKPFVSLEDIENGIIHHVSTLLEVDSYEFVVLVLELLPQLHPRIIRRFVDKEESQGDRMESQGNRLEYVYLKHILSATGFGQVEGEQAELIRELLDRSKLRVEDDPKIQERYVMLLCQFDPENVFPYLEAHGSFSLENCLRLCQQHRITDAEAYLLERTGDVTGALSLILQTIEQKLKILKPALRGFTPVSISTSSLGRQQQESIIESVSEGRDVMRSLDIAISLCQRNSARNRDEQSERLWFTLLDKFLQVQNYIKRSIQGKSTNKKIPMTASTRGTQTAMQMALNDYIRIILERMAAFVSLKAILFKITTEHGNDEFGEFKPTITGMLDTYNYEENIYRIANRLISVDLYEQVTSLHRAQSKCLAPASNTCFYCGVVLNKPSFGMENSGGEKWSAQTSMTMVLATGRTFHESCGKLWQQEIDDQSMKKRGIREMQQREEKSSKQENDEQRISDDIRENRQNDQHSTRRYLNRLRRSRKKTAKGTSLNQVLDSLSMDDTSRRKYCFVSNTSLTLTPLALPKPKRLGQRTPGSLPVKAAQIGGIGGTTR